MYFTKAVPKGTLDLLRRFCADESFDEFCLGGGTSLALRLGHRRSVDLDFFIPTDFDSNALAKKLGRFGTVKVLSVLANSLSAVVADVKVDFVTYRYPMLKPADADDDLRLLSLPDVAAMKLSAVTSRGSKKDFYDIAALLKKHKLPKLIEWHQSKFPDHDPMILMMSLPWFQDAENEPDPQSLNGITWPEVKLTVAAAVKKML